MLKTALSDRRCWWLVIGLAAVVIVSRWAISPATARTAVVHGGYWFALALTGLFLRAGIPLVRARWSRAGFGRYEAGVLAAAVAVTGLWAAHEKPGYKILQDELLLLGTSMGLHYERLAAYPVRSTDIQGSFQVLARVMDKRPLLFPFLTATVHDLTGYRPENPFYLNMVLAVGFLWLAYLVGWRAGQSRWAGVLALALFAGLPLMAQQATGGGFELLNLVLIAGVALLMAAYLEEPGERTLEPLVLGGLLLASTRYESAVFLVVVALAAVVGWQRAGRVILPWPVVLSPLFLFPLLAQNRIFSGESAAWEMASVPGVVAPFSLDYALPNVGHALAFFFDFSGYQPNSVVFAAAGLVALPFFALWVAQALPRLARPGGDDATWCLLGLGLFLVGGVYLFYFWGQFDHPLIRRLSLPVHFLMALAIIVVGTKFLRSRRAWQTAVLAVAGGFVFQSLPVLANQAYRTSYTAGVRMELRGEFLRKLTDRNVLFVDNDSFFWIGHKFSASPIQQAQLRKEGLIYHLRNRSFAEMYVVQSVRVDENTGTFSVEASDDLGPDFELETLDERRVETLLFVRFSRIKAIRNHGVVAAQATTAVTPVAERKTAAELDQARAKFLETWIKNLP